MEIFAVRRISYHRGSLELYDHGKDPHEGNNLVRVSGNENILAELLPLFGVFEEGED